MVGSVGPALPPDLVEARKRKRAGTAATKVKAPSLVQAAATNTHPVEEPSSSTSLHNVQTQSDIGSDVASEKLTKVEVESDDDDIGPVLPSDAGNGTSTTVSNATPTISPHDFGGSAVNQSRPDWMLAPPSASDLARNFNPLKSRGFAPRSRNPKAENEFSSKWTSVPGQSMSMQASNTHDARQKVEPEMPGHPQNDYDEDFASKTKSRGPSLYELHNQNRRRTNENLDDPSKRPFDREKDMGSSNSYKRTKEFVERSKDMKSMFVSGSYS